MSKEDIIQVLVDNEWRRGVVVQLRLDSVRIKIEGTDKVIDVNSNVVKILEKKVKQNQIVPIEVNDLVTLIYDSDVVSGIVVQVQSFVQVIITSPKNNGKDVIVSADKLRFVAKGYLLHDTPSTVERRDSSQATNATHYSPPANDKQTEYTATSK